VLCNEDKLKPGTYRAEARIHGAAGVVWKHPFVAEYPEQGYGNMPPLAAKVMEETVILPAGDYTMHVKLLEGAAPYGGRLPIKVVKTDDSAARGKKVVSWGLLAEAKAFLEEHNVTVTDIAEVEAESIDFDEELLLVGNPDDMDKYWFVAHKWAKKGGTVIFLRTEPLRGDGQEHLREPLEMPTEKFYREREVENRYLQELAGEKARCAYYYNWLYHMDTVHIDHPVFTNTTNAGVMDLETWGDVCPECLFLDMEQPDQVFAAGIGMNCCMEDECARSQALCEYRLGEGRVILNALKVEDNLGRHPFADQILLNMVGEYGRKPIGS